MYLLLLLTYVLVTLVGQYAFFILTFAIRIERTFSYSFTRKYRKNKNSDIIKGEIYIRAHTNI